MALPRPQRRPGLAGRQPPPLLAPAAVPAPARGVPVAGQLTEYLDRLYLCRRAATAVLVWGLAIAGCREWALSQPTLKPAVPVGALASTVGPAPLRAALFQFAGVKPIQM